MKKRNQPTPLTNPIMKTIYLLGLLATVSPSMAFSLVAKPSKFWSADTSSMETPRMNIGTEPTNQVSSSSRLNYSNGNVQEHPKQRSLVQTSSNGQGSKPVIQATGRDYGYEEDTSRKVDEYLEFLDKRYNRMRGNDAPQQNALPIMKWLRAEDHHEEDHSNSLYALGVAGLASERLLQKQGVTLTKCSIIKPTPDASSIIVEHTSEGTPAEGMSLLLNKIFAVFSAKLLSLHRQLSVRRDWVLRSLSRKTKVSAKAALKAFPRATSNLARAAVKASGGERNLRLAATFTCAFAIYIAQPLVKSAITARTQV